MKFKQHIHRFAHYLAFAVLLLSVVSVQAQDDDKPAPYKRPEQSYSRDTVSSDLGKTSSFSPKKKFDIEKLLIEPNIQLFFANNYYQFGLMPSLGYKTWKNLYVGGSLNYNLQYVPHVDGPGTNSPHASVQVYGGGPFVHYKIWKGFFTRLRVEMLAVRYPTSYAYGSTNELVYNTRGIPYLWIGGGYNLTASKNFFIPVAVYINPLYPAYSGGQKSISPYPSIVYFQVAFYIFSPGH
ncbi:MAG: hypothetical protein JST90_18120 [Bacteroidetes bacterium]|nr:hypothetical protein [Bacteroidota bacterium]